MKGFKKPKKSYKKLRKSWLAFAGLGGLLTGFTLLHALLFLLLPLGLVYVLCLICRSSRTEDLKKLRHYRYAHRGLHMQGIPENSLAAFRKALEYGYGAELDVHLLKDGKLAVLHDSDLQRMTGRDGQIEDRTAAELPELKLAGTAESIPLFEDALALFDGREEPLIVELKSKGRNAAALCQAAVAALDRHHVRYMIESFDPFCVMWLRQNRPEILRGQLSMDLMKQKDSDMPAIERFAVTRLLSNVLTCPDFIAYDRRSRHLFELTLCRRLYHVQEVSWTVRNYEELKAAEALGNLVIFENFGW